MAYLRIEDNIYIRFIRARIKIKSQTEYNVVMNQKMIAGLRGIASSSKGAAGEFFKSIHRLHPKVDEEVKRQKASMCDTVLGTQLKKLDSGPGWLDRYDSYIDKYKASTFAPPETVVPVVPVVSDGNGMGRIFNSVIDEKEREIQREKISYVLATGNPPVHGTEANARAAELEEFCLDWALNEQDYVSMVDYIVDNADKAYYGEIAKLFSKKQLPRITGDKDD